MKLSQLVESFVISNDEFEDYLNRATEQLAQELQSGKNARDAIHDLSLTFADQHNKAYDAYVRMQDALTARMHTLELDNASSAPEMGAPDMDADPEMMTDPMGDMEMDTPADSEMPSDSDMEDYAAVMDNEPEAEEAEVEESVNEASCGCCGNDPCDCDDDCDCKKVNEAEEKPYICVHAKKGKHECHASSSYEAAKKAAEHWGMKSTAGIDAHLAVEEAKMTPADSPKGDPYKDFNQPDYVAPKKKVRAVNPKADNARRVHMSGKKERMIDDVNEGRLGFSDIEKFGDEAASKIDMECRRRGSADMEPGEADELRYKVAKEMGYIKESKSEGDAWYIEQDAKKMAEKDGHDWSSLPYGRKSIYRTKAAEMRKGDDEEDMYENMETINKIVADKQAGKINGMTVDMFTASAIKQVYDAVNEDNKAKLDDLMKTKEGVLKVANIAMKMLGEAKRTDEVLPAVAAVARGVGAAVKAAPKIAQAAKVAGAVGKGAMAAGKGVAKVASGIAHTASDGTIGKSYSGKSIRKSESVEDMANTIMASSIDMSEKALPAALNQAHKDGKKKGDKIKVGDQEITLKSDPKPFHKMTDADLQKLDALEQRLNEKGCSSKYKK